MGLKIIMWIIVIGSLVCFSVAIAALFHYVELTYDSISVMFIWAFAFLAILAIDRAIGAMPSKGSRKDHR